MKASDITDEEIYQAVDGIMAKTGMWAASRWDIYEKFPTFPEKVVQAKLRTMVKKGRLEGCACGCRGDFCRPEGLMYAVVQLPSSTEK